MKSLHNSDELLSVLPNVRRIAPANSAEDREFRTEVKSLLRRSTTFVRFRGWPWFGMLMLAGCGAFTPNPWLTAFAIALLPIIVQLLWRAGEPPVLVFACVMQWMQASAVIFYTNFYGMSVFESSDGPEFELATWLSLTGVLVLAIGMRLGLLGIGGLQEASTEADALRLDIRKVFNGYLASFAAASIAGAVAFRIPAIAQLLGHLSAVKWVFVFILAYCAMEQRRGYALLTFAVIMEFSVGLLGFFASFKSIFFVLVVVALTSPRALQGRRLFVTAIAAASLFVSGIVWSAVKSEYREFLNQGSGAQEVLVSVTQRTDKIQDLLANFTWDQVAEGLEAMVLRVSYVYYFAHTIAHVPNNVPFENGALWLGAIKHILTPRMFFPEKASINDSERTALYTGVDVASVEQGTSIGIGYMAESYIDFGPRLMFLPILLLGLFYGLIYRCFVLHARRKLLGSAMASSILIFGAYTIETSNIKMLGGNVVALLIMGSIYFVFGRQLLRWLELK